MMPKVIYQAGPMRGYDNYNFQAFEDGKIFLESLGLEVISPHDIDIYEGWVTARYGHWLDDKTRKYRKSFTEVVASPSLDMTKVLRRDIEAILRVDAISFLPGWQTSQGCLIEDQVARAIGLPIYLHYPDANPQRFDLWEKGTYASCPT